MTTIQSVFDRFLKTDQGRKIEREIETEHRDSRGQLVAERGRLITQAEKVVPELARNKSAAFKKYKAAFEALERANHANKVATAAVWSQSTRHSTAVEKINRQLEVDANPIIEERRQAWYTECERIRRLTITTREETTGRHLGRLSEPETITISNRTGILVAMTAASKCAEAIHALRLENLADIESAIADIEKGLPPIGAFTG